MSNVLRAFQVLNDGNYTVNSTYNGVDEAGNIVKQNVKDSFYAIDPDIKAHIDAIREYILNTRLANK